MRRIKRRTFLKSAAAGLMASPAILRASQPRRTDVRIEEVDFAYEDYAYRVPIKFGGTVTDRVTLLNVNCAVRSTAGKSAKGFGSMPLANAWAFPSRKAPSGTTLGAMKALAARISSLTGSYKEYGHPIDLNWALEPMYLEAAKGISQELQPAHQALRNPPRKRRLMASDSKRRKDPCWCGSPSPSPL